MSGYPQTIEELCDRLRPYLGQPGDSNGAKKLTKYLKDLEKRITDMETKIGIGPLAGDPPPKPPDLGP